MCKSLKKREKDIFKGGKKTVEGKEKRGLKLLTLSLSPRLDVDMLINGNSVGNWT